MRLFTWIPLLGGALIFGLAGCSESVSEAPESPAKPTKGGALEEIASEPVEDPCDCFNEGLSRGQLKYCREAKRNIAFLETLRNCGTGEVGGVSDGNPKFTAAPVPIRLCAVAEPIGSMDGIPKCLSYIAR